MPLFGRKQQEEAPAQQGPDDPLGQNRVFYSRENGIVTYWYLAHRCDEECYRAQRYDRPLSLLVIELTATSGSTPSRMQLAATLRSTLRAADVAAYTGTDYAVLLPETTKEQAEELAGRLRTQVPGAVTCISAFPDDGADLTVLTEAARSRLPAEAKQAAA
jgi:hypothetical protein